MPGRWPCAVLVEPVPSGFRVPPRVRSSTESTPRRAGIPEAGVRSASNQSSPRSTVPMAAPHCHSCRRSSEQGHDGVSKRDPPQPAPRGLASALVKLDLSRARKCDHARVPPCGLNERASAAVHRAPCHCGESARASRERRRVTARAVSTCFLPGPDSRVVQFRPWGIALVPICSLLVVGQS